VSAGRKPLGQILVERGACAKEDIERALSEQARVGGHLGDILQAMGKLERQQLLTALGVQAGLGLVDLDKSPPSPAAIKRLDAERRDGIFTRAFGKRRGQGAVELSISKKGFQGGARGHKSPLFALLSSL